MAPLAAPAVAAAPALALILAAGAIGRRPAAAPGRRSGRDALAGAHGRGRSGGCDVTVASLRRRARRPSAAPGHQRLPRRRQLRRADLDADKSGADVTVRAEHPGEATIAGADLSGSHLALARFRRRRGNRRSSRARGKISVLHNRISGGYFGVEAGPTTTTSISDTTIAGNQLRRPLRRGRDPAQPLPRQRRPRPLRGPDRRQRDHRRARERQPQRLPAVGLGRRRPLLPPQLPARQPLPGLLRQRPAGAVPTSSSTTT